MCRDDVIAAYRMLLGREPNSQEVEGHLGHASPAKLIEAFASSIEFRRRVGSSPFFHYNTALDVVGIVERHVLPTRRALPGHIVNFLGVAMNAEFMPHHKERAGQLDEIPIPANYHADMAEWAAVLRSLELANKNYTMIELGCGWGCWMNNTGVVAKRLGLRTHVIGIEADQGYIRFAQEALATNRINPSEYTLIRGVAAATGGFALFPRQDDPGGHWGLEPIFGASEKQVDEAVRSGRYDKVRVVPLAEAVGSQPIIDLLHIDIQGGEAGLVRDCISLLTERIAYIVIGTHSREIEGLLISELLRAGQWRLEIERPAIFQITPHGLQTNVDGVQGWRNIGLRPDRKS